MTPSFKWKLVSRGHIQLGRQHIIFDEDRDRFLWKEDNSEGGLPRDREDFQYLCDAKMKAEGRHREMILVGLEESEP